MNLRDCKTLEEVKPFVEAEKLYAVDTTGFVRTLKYGDFHIKLGCTDTTRQSLHFCAETTHIVWFDVFTSEQIAILFAENIKREALKKEYNDLADQMTKLLERMLEIRHLLPQDFTEKLNVNQLYNALKNQESQ